MIDRAVPSGTTLQRERPHLLLGVLQWPAVLLVLLVGGYMMMSRGFAHLGAGPIYIGEAVLAALVILRPDVIIKPWVDRLFHDGPLTVLAYLAVAFVLYGALQLARGLGGPYTIDALKNFAFNYYVAFLFAGIWLGRQYPQLLTKLVYVLSWVLGIYGICYLGFLSDQSQLTGGLEPPPNVFGQPNGCAMIILALLAFFPDLRTIAIPLLLNAAVVLGNQRRAEWLAFGVALVILSMLTRRMQRLLLTVALLAGLLLVGLITDFKIPAPNIRGGDISARAIVGRAIATVDKRAAAQFTREAATLSGTVDWRTGWWKNIVHAVHESPGTSIYGFGYSYPIWDLHPEGIPNIRTPHNIAMFALTYGGWLGVLVYYAFHCQLGWCLWKVYRLNGNAFGISLWIVLTVWGPFDNFLEAPFGAIPFYILCGIQLAPLLGNEQGSSDLPDYRDPARLQTVS